MRKKSIALVGVTAVLTSWGLQTIEAAQAAQAASPVSAVQVAWADLAQGQIKITWTESSPVANTVQLNTGAPQPRQLAARQQWKRTSFWSTSATSARAAIPRTGSPSW